MRHRDRRLNPEILDDYFLDMSIALVQFANCQQRFNAVCRRFADADQKPRGERDARFPASSMVRKRLAGSLSGALSCAAPEAIRPAFTVSNISPMLGDTADSRAIHSELSNPGLGCGNKVVSRSTNSHIASR